MDHQHKTTSKLASLDAAQRVYFIVAALSIRESLSLVSHDYQTPAGAVPLSEAARWTLCLAYLVTLIRFSHGTSLLWGAVKSRAEKAQLPTAAKVSMTSLFLVCLGIALFLMAYNIQSFPRYVFLFEFVLAIDFIFLLQSKVLRSPFGRVRRLWSDTFPGTAPRAALQWMTSDLLLFVICLIFQAWGPRLGLIVQEVVFAVVLIAASVLDYVFNAEFYFGGRLERQQRRIAFVCSPLGSALEAKNIASAQFYCKELMKRHPRKGGIAPFASHAFYTYFLDDRAPIDRIIGRRCALAYLSACDAIYVYLPLAPVTGLRSLLLRLVSLVPGIAQSPGPLLGLRKFDKAGISRGMQNEIETARKEGLPIRYRVRREELPPDWKPSWELPAHFDASATGSSALNEELKRVYVCTPFRGPRSEGDLLNKDTMNANIAMTLRICQGLARREDKHLAPIAPHAFYPYFWNFFDPDGSVNRDKWDEWFECSIEILKACDAVYVYTPDGLPDGGLSEGMTEVVESAHSLGLEIRYFRIPQSLTDWTPALPF